MAHSPKGWVRAGHRDDLRLPTCPRLPTATSRRPAPTRPSRRGRHVRAVSRCGSGSASTARSGRSTVRLAELRWAALTLGGHVRHRAAGVPADRARPAGYGEPRSWWQRSPSSIIRVVTGPRPRPADRPARPSSGGGSARSSSSSPSAAAGPYDPATPSCLRSGRPFIILGAHVRRAHSRLPHLRRASSPWRSAGLLIEHGAATRPPAPRRSFASTSSCGPRSPS